MDPYGTIASGLVLGLSGGLTPGPTTALVLSETLRHGLRAGAKVAFAPLLTDGPIVATSLVVLGGLSTIEGVLGWIHVAGAAALGYLGVATMRVRPEGLRAGIGASGALWRGVLANTVNPHPWVFWALVGGPLLLDLWHDSAPAAVGFLVAFYGAIVGSKVMLAALVHRGRGLLAGRTYRIVVRALGGMLLLFGLWFLTRGLSMLS